MLPSGAVNLDLLLFFSFLLPVCSHICVTAVIRYLTVNETVNYISSKCLLPGHVCWRFNVEATVGWGPDSSTCSRLVFRPQLSGSPADMKEEACELTWHGERRVCESLMSLWAAVVFRQEHMAHWWGGVLSVAWDLSWQRPSLSEPRFCDSLTLQIFSVVLYHHSL